jgi:hypothetical protein
LNVFSFWRIENMQLVLVGLEVGMVEKDAVQGFQEAGLSLRTGNGGNRFSPFGSVLAAANLRLAGLRYVSGFPSAQDSLAFCQQKLEARCLRSPSRTPDFSRLPNYAPWTVASGAFNAREQSFRVISVAHAQIVFRNFRRSGAGQFSEFTIPHFPPGMRRSGRIILAACCGARLG